MILSEHFYQLLILSTFPGIDLSDYYPSVEWDILGVPGKRHEKRLVFQLYISLDKMGNLIENNTRLLANILSFGSFLVVQETGEE